MELIVSISVICLTVFALILVYWTKFKCWHVFALIKRTPIYTHKCSKGSLPISFDYISQCTKCGKLKRKEY